MASVRRGGLLLTAFVTGTPLVKEPHRPVTSSVCRPALQKRDKPAHEVQAQAFLRPNGKETHKGGQWQKGGLTATGAC